MSKIQLYIGTDLLDFNEQINVKRQLNDYRNPEIGGNVTSYTINIPLTRLNRRILRFVDDIRSREEISDEARIIVDGMEIIRGKLRVLRSRADSCTIIIEGNDWVNDIAGISIQDLSWAGGDEHTFSSANIVASWTAAAGAFYRYPLFNFSELISGDYGAGGSAIYSYEFYPAWSVEDIVTKMLLGAGYTLDTGGFFSTTFGKGIYILSKANPLPDDFITGKEMKAYVNDDTDNQDTNPAIISGGTAGVSFAQVLDLDAEFIDEGADFNISTNRYTAPSNGTYRFQTEVDIFCTFNRSPGNWSVVSNSITLTIRKNGSTTLETISVTGVTTFDFGNNVFTLDTGYVYLESGDTVEVYLSVSAVGTNDSPGTLSATIYVDAGVDTSFFQLDWSEQNLWPGIGQTISPGEFLPDIDSLEFLKGLKALFNLRFWVDRNNKRAYIETSDDFYGSTVIDWSDKIDYSNSPEMERIVTNYKATQRLKLNPDTSDKAYTNEVSANGVPYQYDVFLDSEYSLPGMTEVANPILSPTPLGSMPQIGHWGPNIVPRIFGSGEFVSASRAYPASRAKQWAPRIFEWYGMRSFVSGNFDYYEDIEDTTPISYTTFPGVVTPDMEDMYLDFWLKDYNRIEKNNIVTCELILTPIEIMKFMTVVGTAANEGFRATYKLNVEGIDMYYLVASIVTDGSRVKAELIQKL